MYEDLTELTKIHLPSLLYSVERRWAHRDALHPIHTRFTPDLHLIYTLAKRYARFTPDIPPGSYLINTRFTPAEPPPRRRAVPSAPRSLADERRFTPW